MSLHRMKDLLTDARNKKYAVGAFNLLNLESVMGAIEAAEELNSPIIFQLAEIQLKETPIEYMIPMMVSVAKKSSVPVAVHFDHGLTFENIFKAIKYGCTSIMFDGAAKSLEENISLTRQAAFIAHNFDLDIEAELGVVGGGEAGSYGSVKEVLTNVQEAEKFLIESDCDFLAVAIGNAHGPYVSTPDIKIERLKEINAISNVPLVLHGGSGISDETFRECIENGICKINIATSMQQNVLRKHREFFNAETTYVELMNLHREAVYEEVKRHINIFMSNEKAKSFRN